jgi:hypothetical protein
MQVQPNTILKSNFHAINSSLFFPKHFNWPDVIILYSGQKIMIDDAAITPTDDSAWACQIIGSMRVNEALHQPFYKENQQKKEMTVVIDLIQVKSV